MQAASRREKCPGWCHNCDSECDTCKSAHYAYIYLCCGAVRCATAACPSVSPFIKGAHHLHSVRALSTPLWSPPPMLGSLTNPQITAKLLVSPNNFPCGSETRSDSRVLFVRESHMSWQLSNTGDGEMKRSACFRTKNRCSLCVP